MPKKPRGGRPRNVRFRSRVVVRFKPAVDVPKGARIVDPARLGPWSDLVHAHPGCSLAAVYEGRHLATWAAVTARAQAAHRKVTPRNRAHLFYVDAPPGTDFDRLARDLSDWTTVERAWVRRVAPPPTVFPDDDDEWPAQLHLDAANSVRARDGLGYDGVDAELAWGFPGGDGAGVRVVDIEGGCNTMHPDLALLPWMPRLAGAGADSVAPSSWPALVAGVNLGGTARLHGTEMVGIVCAEDGEAEAVGIAPNLERVGVVSSVLDASGAHTLASVEQAIADAIADVPDGLRKGDVLLLEQQLWFPEPVAAGAAPTGLGYLVPLEADENLCGDIDDVVNLLGITVVEPGGNGRARPDVAVGDIGLDLGTYVDQAGRNVLGTVPAPCGAILVSAGIPGGTHRAERESWAPYGDRVDCWAWGEGVRTTSGTSGYAHAGGTSAAAAIVAGVVAVLQGILRAHDLTPKTPAEMLQLLRNPANGTPQSSAPSETGFPIRAMPDLRKLLTLDVKPPELYVPWFPGDFGDRSVSDRCVGISPEILVMPRFPVGPVGPNLDSTPPVTDGVEYEARVTVHNRGGTPATNAVVDVYWAAPATVITPDMWQPIGRATVPSVAPQGAADAAVGWRPSGVPPDGAVAIVVAVGTERAPPPQPADLATWRRFLRYASLDGHVAYRCVRRVAQSAMGTNPGGAWLELPFRIAGADDERLAYDFTVAPQLPQNARVAISARGTVLDALQGRVGAAARRGNRIRTIKFAPDKPAVHANVGLDAGVRESAVLRVWIPPADRSARHAIAIVQSWKGREVGRLTWQLTP